MSRHQSYITLDTIINDYLNESEQPNHKYYKLFHLAFRGFEQLGIDFFYQIKTVKLPVNSNYTVVLPSDYLNWTKVGALNNKGEIIPLYYNSKLTTYADLNPDRLSQTRDTTIMDWANWGINTWFNYWSGSGYTNIYGVPSGAPFVGNFKIDATNGILLLDEGYSYDYVMIEYVSSPCESEQYNIPIQFREALIAWIWWKDKRAVNVNRGQVGISRDLRDDFNNERRNAIARWKPIRKSQIYQASKEQTRLAVKS